MKILLTNDDGIHSPVLTLLSEALSIKHEVIVVAPADDQSGMAQAFTFGRGLTYQTISTSPYRIYRVNGTPCDCIKFTVSHLCPNEKIDLMISGINLGENAGVSAIYSGTVAAAREAALWGIPAVAVSVWKNSLVHLNHAVKWLTQLMDKPELLALEQSGYWNVNFPPCDPEDISGVEITSMSDVMFRDDYQAVNRADGTTEYRLVGHKPVEKFLKGSDDFALQRGKITITPLQLSQSNGMEMKRLQALEGRWSFR